MTVRNRDPSSLRECRIRPAPAVPSRIVDPGDAPALASGGSPSGDDGGSARRPFPSSATQARACRGDLRSIPYRGPCPPAPSAQPVPHALVRRAASVRRRERGAARGLGEPAARPGRADLPRPARPARGHPGRDRSNRCAGSARDGEQGPDRVRGHGRRAGREARRRARRTSASRPARSRSRRPR